MKSEIVALAKQHGACLLGIAGVDDFSEYSQEVTARLQETKASGKDFMLPADAEGFFRELADVPRKLPWAKSAVLIGAFAYDTKSDYSGSRRQLRGKTARTYSYYPVVRQIAEQITEFLIEAGFHAVHGQQIPLKFAVARTGLGAYGHNGLILTKDFGTYVAWRTVITDAELEPDAFEPPALPCNDCGRCLKACPTNALYAPYKVNPALCINPLTRKEEDVPPELRKKMGSWVCGCDICQQVCQMNKGLRQREPDPRAVFDSSNHASHRTLQGLDKCPDLEDLLLTSDFAIMKRNAIIALGNIGSQEACDVLQRYAPVCPAALQDYLQTALAQIERRSKPVRG